MAYRKKLIEVALPLEAINKASALEKSPRPGSPSTLHLWWARRPLAAARAVIFSSLIDDPDDPQADTEFVEACRKLPKGKNSILEDTPRRRLFDFIERLVQWDSMTNKQILSTARELIHLSTKGNIPPFFDPFGGGGSIPLEAQRLGLDTHVGELNPVAVVINKALIEIPPLFSNKPPINPGDRERMDLKGGWRGTANLVADIRYYGEIMRNLAQQQIGHLYPHGPNNETVIAWIWARTVQSPNPAVTVHVPLISSYILCSKKGKRTWLEPQIDKQTHAITYKLKRGDGTPPKGTMSRSGGQCIISGTPITWDYIQAEGQAQRMGAQMIAIVTEGKNGRSYYTANEEHENIVKRADPAWEPRFNLSTHPQYMAPTRYGMDTVADLFNKRQLAALEILSSLVSRVREQAYFDALESGLPDDDMPLRDAGIGARAYSEAIGVYLSLAVGRQANRLSTLCWWDSGGEKVQQVFSRQAFTMNWNFTEANPFSNSSGNFMGQLHYLLKAVEKLEGSFPGTVLQQDAVTYKYPSKYLFSTDPPYYDNVPYADLSDFFYVWIRRGLSTIYPEIFSTLLVPKKQELVADNQRLGGRDEANRYFEDGLKQVFINIRQASLQDFPLTVYYAFKQSEIVKNREDDEGVVSTAWETMLTALLDAGFAIQGTWPMRTEQTGNIKKYRNTLASSIVLVCRPRRFDSKTTSRRDFVNILRDELPKALRDMQSGNIVELPRFGGQFRANRLGCKGILPLVSSR